MHVVSSLLPVLLVTIAGCGGETPDAGVPDTGTDAGADAGNDAGNATPPSIPWFDERRSPATLTPCPEGWHVVAGEFGDTCDAYGPEGPLTCPAGQGHFPGEDGCRPVGDACPTGEFAPDLPTDGTVFYVSATADPGGDGSLSRPYAGLGELNFSGVSAGETVALGKGTYEGLLTPRAGVRVVGACAAETLVTGTLFPAPSVIRVTSAGDPAVVRNLTISNAPQRGASVEAGRSLRLEGVVIDAATSFGVEAEGARSVLELVDSVVRATHPSPAERFGIAAYAHDGARLTATRTLFLENGGSGVYSGVGGEVSLTRCVVRDTRPPSPGGPAFAIYAVGGLLEATEVLLADNAWVGVLASDPGTEVRLTDVIVRDTHPSVAGGPFGRGFEISDVARVEATRVDVARNHDLGMVIGEGAVVVLEDVVIRDTLPAGGGGAGRGIGATSDAQITASRLLVSGNQSVGIRAGDADTHVSLADTWVHGTLPTMGDDLSGMGVVIGEGASLDASRLAVTENHSVAIAASYGGSRIALTDAIVAGTLTPGGAPTTGRGIQIAIDAALSGERVRVESVAVTGLSVGAADVTLRDLVIAGVRATACLTTPCSDRPYGYAAASQGGVLDLERFEIGDAETCGVFLSRLEDGTAPEVDLRTGTVSTSAIGACVQVEGYDLGRLTNAVEYRDNGSSLESTNLPVPELPGVD